MLYGLGALGVLLFVAQSLLAVSIMGGYPLISSQDASVIARCRRVTPQLQSESLW